MSSGPLTRRPIAQPTRRARDYTRTFKACDTCRKKKTRCILDAPEASRTACRKCKRERKECSLSQATSSRKPSNRLASSEPSDCIMGMSYLPRLILR
ncbi:hypothetical protein ASPSYDRAFT_49557 [Aspergillus sydowii CBS 593.65]|uniref:Zn(2)-C6 fungal-type domain-containing protein n=1 Tax=Aspergillus sydowii CBS 593.65 TaxID=1036612 RepID=A0A1L9T4T9_9EURO|nr:uncharacterized protein ASPSYDRAFT_49557 [Aspergillus sydowii CBS 593.65]OJJ54415.1 hypothetical protein ASPSYDRAFT_49557 [Aspergillus sydowii CBS 593.65]